MIFTVTSIASQCCTILFLMGRLHLPHQKADALASCTPNANAHPCDSMYWTYLSRKGILGDVPVYNSANRRITQIHLLKVEWWGTQHGPRVKLLGRPFVHSYLASKKQGDMSYTDFYTWWNLANDIHTSTCHLSEVPSNTFYITN